MLALILEADIYIYIYIYIYVYNTYILYKYIDNININLPVNAMVRLPRPWSRDSQGQEMLLALYADN